MFAAALVAGLRLPGCGSLHQRFKQHVCSSRFRGCKAVVVSSSACSSMWVLAGLVGARLGLFAGVLVAALGASKARGGF